MKWMFESEWFGEVTMLKGCHITPEHLPVKILHDRKKVWGIVEANSRESALDEITAYMVEHGDDIGGNLDEG